MSTEHSRDRDEARPTRRRSHVPWDRHVDWLQRAIRRREAALSEQQEAIDELRHELESVYASTSWRLTAPLRGFSSSHGRAAAVLRTALRLAYWTATLRLPRRLRSLRAAREAARRDDRRRRELSYERWIELYDTLTSDDLGALRSLANALDETPLVSVVMPVFDPPEWALVEAIQSVLDQVYENWELCIADDASTEPHVRRVLDAYARRDPRIRVVYRASNGGISAASNSALEIAQGELVALLDHDDVIRPHALLLVVREFAADERVGFVYSDEDQIDEHGRRYGHNFKPDWDPTLLLSQNYVCHFAVFRIELVREGGGFRSEYDGSQDWDLALRVSSMLPSEGVAHIPHVLYHWRAIPGSAALGVAAKPYAVDAGRRAAADHLRGRGQRCYLVPVGTHQSVRYALPDPPPSVSAIVPSTGDPTLLDACIRSLLDDTDYPSLDVVVVVSEEARVRQRRYLTELERDPRVHLHTYAERAFNYAWAVNFGAAKAAGELLLLLNDDIRAARDDWLEAMVGQVLQDGVGAAGALLLYEDRTIQHAGMLLGAGDAKHLYRRRPAGIAGYVNRARLPRGVSAVTGACMLVRRELFVALDGMDEALEVAYNDVDLCLKLRRAGWRIVFVPDAILYHRESASFGSLTLGREDAFSAERRRIRTRWHDEVEDDRFHNPNLALDAAYPSRLAFPPRRPYPWRRDELPQGPARHVARLTV
jgi:GT2 family glycosyltransferase